MDIENTTHCRAFAIMTSWPLLEVVTLWPPTRNGYAYVIAPLFFHSVRWWRPKLLWPFDLEGAKTVCLEHPETLSCVGRHFESKPVHFLNISLFYLNDNSWLNAKFRRNNVLLNTKSRFVFCSVFLSLLSHELFVISKRKVGGLKIFFQWGIFHSEMVPILKEVQAR